MGPTDDDQNHVAPPVLHSLTLMGQFWMCEAYSGSLVLGVTACPIVGMGTHGWWSRVEQRPEIRWFLNIWMAHLVALT